MSRTRVDIVKPTSSLRERLLEEDDDTQDERGEITASGSDVEAQPQLAVDEFHHPFGKPQLQRSRSAEDLQDTGTVKLGTWEEEADHAETSAQPIPVAGALALGSALLASSYADRGTTASSLRSISSSSIGGSLNASFMPIDRATSGSLGGHPGSICGASTVPNGSLPGGPGLLVGSLILDPSPHLAAQFVASSSLASSPHPALYSSSSSSLNPTHTSPLGLPPNPNAGGSSSDAARSLSQRVSLSRGSPSPLHSALSDSINGTSLDDNRAVVTVGTSHAERRLGRTKLALSRQRSFSCDSLNSILRELEKQEMVYHAHLPQHSVPTYAIPPQLFWAPPISHFASPRDRQSLDEQRLQSTNNQYASLQDEDEGVAEAKKDHTAWTWQDELAVIASYANSMVGGGVLVLPWGFTESGMVVGTLISMGICGMCCYTATLIVDHTRTTNDLSELAGQWLGRWAKIVSIIAMTIMLVGATCSYNILLADCMYEVVEGFQQLWQHHWVAHTYHHATEHIQYQYRDEQGTLLDPVNTTCRRYSITCWSPTAAALVVVAIILPLSCVKSLHIFVKLSSVGPIFLIYLFLFMIVQSLIVGPVAPAPLANTWYYDGFPHLSGVLMCSFFIHHAVIPIGKTFLPPLDLPLPEDEEPLLFDQNPINSKQQGSHNSYERRKQVLQEERRGINTLKRALCVAFFIALLCYCVPGIVGNWSTQYIEAHARSSVSAMNFLSSFPLSHGYALSARICVACQLMTIMPLLLYIIRTQVFGMLFDDTYPGVIGVITLNVVLLCLTTTCAICQVGIGNIMRYSGAGCGLVLIFCIPIGIHLQTQKVQGTLTMKSLVVNVLLCFVALLLLLLQFVPQSTIVAWRGGHPEYKTFPPPHPRPLHTPLQG